MPEPVFAFFGIGAPGGPELIIVLIVALLLFGKRLPEVARSMGKGLVEFKRGMSGLEDEVENAAYSSSTPSSSRPIPDDDPDEMTAPKFEPPESAPVETEEQQA